MECVESTSQIIDTEDIKPDIVLEVCGSDSEHESVNSDVAIKSQYTSDSEQSILSSWDEDEKNYNPPQENCYYGQGGDKYKWMIQEFNVDEKKININFPCLTDYARQLGDAPEPIDVWNLLFTEEMLLEIVMSTNHEINRQRSKYKTPNSSDVRDIDSVEMKALLGLLIYTSAFNSNHEDLPSLFATDGTGREIFRCITTSSRFAFVLGCLRFNNSDERIETETDSAAANSIFKKFIENSQTAYLPSLDCCVDEMLIPFKGKCKFKIFMPNKLKKYGLKLTCLTDATNSYCYNVFIDTNELFLSDKIHNRATKVILHLTNPIWETYRNITADTWFTSMEVCDELRNHGLTYVGALKRTCWEIPKEFLPKRGRAVGTSLYGFLDSTTLLSYVPKKNKALLLISTKHHYRSDDSETKIPEIKTFYDRTKRGVISLEGKMSKNSCSRRARLWATAIFYRLLDLCSINTQILYEMYKHNEAMARTDFLKKLARSLVQQELENRATKRGLRRDLKMIIRRVLGGNFAPDPLTQPFVGKPEKRKCCSVCPVKKNRKTRYVCYLCGCPMCLECSQKVCKICFEDPDIN